MKSVFACVGIYLVMLRGSEGATKFIIDDDWLLGIQYPWPFDVCLQTSASVFGQTPLNFTYYECSTDGQSVTKRKWSSNVITTLSADFDCSDNTGAIETVFTYDSMKTSCDSGYFECTGDSNYASAIFRGSLSEECGDGSELLTLITSIATGVCYCDAERSVYGRIGCSSYEATAYNYTDAACTTAGNPNSSVLGIAHQCSSMPETIEYNTLQIHVSGEMAGCVAAGQETIISKEPTAMPTEQPTKSPVTAAPTQSPVKGSAYMVTAATSTSLVMALFTLFFVN